MPVPDFAKDGRAVTGLLSAECLAQLSLAELKFLPLRNLAGGERQWQAAKRRKKGVEPAEI